MLAGPDKQLSFKQNPLIPLYLRFHLDATLAQVRQADGYSAEASLFGLAVLRVAHAHAEKAEGLVQPCGRAFGSQLPDKPRIRGKL